MKFGVIRFPGSCDELDALSAAARVGEATLLWHADRDLQGVDLVARAREPDHAELHEAAGSSTRTS